MRALTVVSKRARSIFDGTITPWPASLFRVGVGLVVLVRTTDALSPIADLDHHAWVRGIENAPWIEAMREPHLASPLVPGLDVLLASPIAGVLVVARTALAALLVTGPFPRVFGAILAILGYGIMAADRFRYLHHVHLLWMMVALAALLPSGERLAIRVGRAGPPRSRVPRWTLQLARLASLVVYAASGIAKLRGDWLDGSTLAYLARAGLVDRELVELTGAAPLAIGICALELALVPMLAWRRSRALAVVIAVVFHALSAECMMVSTFPVQMALLLSLWLPWAESPGNQG